MYVEGTWNSKRIRIRINAEPQIFNEDTKTWEDLKVENKHRITNVCLTADDENI